MVCRANRRANHFRLYDNATTKGNEMIKTINHSDGHKSFWAVCNECRSQEGPLVEGVQHKEDALNVAIPFRWMQSRRLGTNIMEDYCPQCSVSPEYRR